jgi:hypothetical protein
MPEAGAGSRGTVVPAPVILSEAKEPKPEYGPLRFAQDDIRPYRSARLRNASRPALIASHTQITPNT